jgi:type IV pilus assembly protein PilM
MGLPFTSSYTKKPDQIIAIDLGAKTTKAVHVQRRGDAFTLLNYSVVDAPVCENPFAPDGLAEHFKDVVRNFAGKVKSIAIALGVQDTVFKQIELPLMPLPDLRLMLKYNSKTYLQQDLTDHVFDCQYTVSVTGRGNDAGKPVGSQKQKTIVAAARKQLIENCQIACKTAGLHAQQIVPGLVGPVNAFELSEPEAFGRDVIALVDFGFRTTSITIIASGEIALNRVLGIGGDRLTAGLAESLGISYQEADNIKIGMPSEVAQNLELLIHPLGREIRASIDYFENHHDKAVSKVLVSGGTARSELVVSTLQAELMVPCELWNPTRSLQVSLPPERISHFESHWANLTVAVGTAAASF